MKITLKMAGIAVLLIGIGAVVFVPSSITGALLIVFGLLGIYYGSGNPK